MKNTTDTRYPFKKLEADIPSKPEVVKAVHPTKRLILENRCAAPGAKIIWLLPADS